ncbi:hypothetical protein ACH4E8_17900 [Streptomyces sp. NPDC017979]|uniref:hypothetical protein n=1 Tax=Streptomyces sp. NPDC017979 TaxID=3365024 RepID=UPI0037B022CF
MESTKGHAVWTGRFQPPHVGHFSVLNMSIARLRMPHVVVLTSHFGWESEGEYGRHARDAYRPHLNHFTPWERSTLMRLGLEEYNLLGQVIISIAPRHDLDWNLVAGFYPADRIICLTAKDEFERVKAELWLARGERVHVFDDIGPDVLTTTHIRQRVASGEDWRRYLPASCHAYFIEIDGPRRAFGMH